MKSFSKLILPLIPSVLFITSCGVGTSSLSASSYSSSLGSSSSVSESSSSSIKDSSSSSSASSSSLSSSLSSSASSSEEDIKHTLFVVGDSTVCDFPSETTYYRRYGYGTQLDQYLNTENLTVNNLALSGRSSKSFISEANYTSLTSSISKGDYLIIGFGHNDEKAEEARYTNPNGDYKTEGSFAYYLYTYYVKPALDNGAYPILCTPICRYSETKNYTGSSAHITSDSGTYKGGDYPKAIRDLGTDLSLPVIDLTEETKNLYTSSDLSEDDVKHLFSWTSPTSMYDTTHTSIWGAKYNAYFIAKDIKSTSSSLKDYVKADISAPTRAADLTVNPNYVEVSTGDGSFTASSLYTSVQSPWYGTGMGAIGGTPLASNLSTYGNVIETDESNIEVIAGDVASKNNKGGKISSSADGFYMAFQSKDLDNDYLFSAKMTIKALPDAGTVAASLNQIGFGLMIRGDILIDNKTNIGTNYASAGFYYSGSGTVAKGPYVRDGSLKDGESDVDETKLVDGAVFDVSIKKFNTLADGTADYLCTIGEYSSTFTLNIKSGTSNKMFLGCYAARCADISFADIKIENQN